ncbi:MAG: response regulator [Chloroflexi bacterium]|nr:response regulator [Chloroflexota bacterium]
MENLGTILQGVASLAWPLLIAFILISFRASIKNVLDSARSRKFILKVGNNELTMEEASEQQRILVSDLQKQVVAIQESLKMLTQAQPSGTLASEVPPTIPKPSAVNSILWVDDNPKNNAYLTESLSELGIEVITALSTAEALEKFRSRKFDRVITDLGRKEGWRYNSTAGIELVKEIRKIDRDVPIVIYTSNDSVESNRLLAKAAGANEITASPTALLNTLQVGLTQ